MTVLGIPNRPAGTDQRSIEAILADFDAVISWANGNIDANNLSAAAAQSAGMNTGAAVAKGSSIIATSEGTGSAAYTTLTTPDRVTGLVLPTAGLLAVWYQATWAESVSAAAKAAIFIGANQLKGAFSNALNLQEVGIGGTPNISEPLSTFPGGLTSFGASSGYPGDTTTGQVIAVSNNGGPCYIFAAAGTYTVSVQFKASSGTVAVVNRRLYVQALSFA